MSKKHKPSQTSQGSGQLKVATTKSTKSNQDICINAVKYFPSAVNIGVNKERLQESTTASPRPVVPLGDTEQYTNLSDVVAVSMICNTHKRVALTELDNIRGLYLPCKQLDSGKDGVECTLNELIRKFVDVQNCKCFLPINNLHFF